MSRPINPASIARPTMLTSSGESKNAGNKVTIVMRTDGEYRRTDCVTALYRHRVARRLSSFLLVCSAVLIGATPVHAQESGSCTVDFNGVEADRIDSLNSPLELHTDDILIFSGSDPAGTRSAELKMIIGPVTVKSNTTTYATPEQEFLATITLDDVSPYGVGLFRAEGSTDGCTASVWIRVSGRFPLATLTGLTALGLALGGITGQLGAIASRRRWARSAAALGGIATGAGLTLIGQEFGRLQVSYPSLAGIAAVAAGLGFILASLINPTIKQQRRDKHRSGSIRAARQSSKPEPSPSAPKAVPASPAAPTHPSEPSAQPKSETADEPAAPDPDTDKMTNQTVTEHVPQPVPRSGPYWCYVMAPTDVFDLTDHTKTIAELAPGNWYLAKRTLSGWAHVVAAEGSEGWVAEGAIHRQG